MARRDASWWAGFLAVLCAFLWLFSGMLPIRRLWLGHRMAYGSPMDMPAWYRRPWEYGAQYTASGPTVVQHQLIFRKRLAVRGYW